MMGGHGEALKCKFSALTLIPKVRVSESDSPSKNGWSGWNMEDISGPSEAGHPCWPGSRSPALWSCPAEPHHQQRRECITIKHRAVIRDQDHSSSSQQLCNGALLSPALSVGRHRESERLSDLSKVMQLDQGQCRCKPKSIQSQSLS